MTKAEAAQLVPGDKVRLIEFTEATLPEGGVWFPEQLSGAELIVSEGLDNENIATIQVNTDRAYYGWMYLDIRLISHREV